MTERTGQLPTADGELWALVEAIVEETTSAEQRDRLEARLRAEPQARRFYVAYLDLHAHLQWRTRGESKAAAASPAPRRLPYRATVAVLTLAAGLLAVLLVHRPGAEDGGPDLPGMPAGSVAVLIDHPNTVWEKDTTLPTGTGSAVPPGRLKLKAGVVEIAFHGGGEVRLEGPADFDISAPDQAFLHRGKLLAQVPEGARAFRIGMPGVVVTDRGGECGLLSDESGRTEVHVFDGQVGADPTDRQGEPLPGVHLAEQAGARVDAASHALTPVRLDEQAFAVLRPEVRVANATVRAGQFAGRNFGTVARLVVKNSIPDFTWDTYLRFDLSGVKGQVAEATVRLMPLHVGQPFDNAAALVADHHWGETTMTWDNKPFSEPAFARWTVEESKPVEFDVTRFVQAALAGDKKLSLRIFAPERKRGSHFVEYGSRIGDAESRPQLVIVIVP